jgi:cellulose synthase/poly-beta-1,6-N-acetylglucosamine synthase-like glycosyltransferase
MEIIIILDILLILSAIFYLLVHLGLIAGLKSFKGIANNATPFISVIIAARNEEQNISKLLHHLIQQTYKNYEIILINDRSIDKTLDIILEFQHRHSKIKSINIASLPLDMPAKKNALRVGIQASSGEILCFTDADCFPPSSWLENIVEQFDPEVGLVAGYSPYIVSSDSNNSLARFIEYEEFRAAIWSAGSIGLNLGWLCTGRNLAYRRKVYDQLNGFEEIKMSVSGDDDLFLQLVRRKTNWKIRYMLSKESFVPTVAPNRFQSFVEQRKRHFSAAKYFSFCMKSFFFFYHFSNLFLFISPFLFILNLLSPVFLVLSVFSKIISDSLLIIFYADTFDSHRYCKSFFLMEVLYVFYNSLIGPLGIIGKFKWK